MNASMIAAARFGYGVNASGSPAGSDPKGWLLQQLAAPEMPASLASLAPSTVALGLIQQLRMERRAAKLAAGNGNAAQAGAAPQQGAPQQNATGDIREEAMPIRKELAADYLAEVDGRLTAAAASNTPLIERLAAFWANHFTVSGVRPEVRPLAGGFEREAIRPHVTGRFHDMLLAVVQHPAMLLYLDNAFSVGPDSPAGQRNNRGLNENLGRELLELHTLGVDGGYTEEDVRAMARILTGWSIGRPRDPDPGHFRFYDRLHEPGTKIFLGHEFPESGMDEGLQALALIARHPSTAHHIATQLARHFVSDNPPPAVVDRLAAAFRDSEGDLGHVTEVLIRSPEPWQDYGSKIKTPYDLVVSSLRLTGMTIPPKQAMNSLRVLGQPLFMAPSPAGWPDDNGAWIGPEAILRRIQWVQALADKASPSTDPHDLARLVLTSASDGDLDQALSGAESRQTGLALLLASPAFQRR